MQTRVIDIHQDKRYLKLHRGFMVVMAGDEELGRIPLDDIAAVIVSGHGITHSSNLLAALAKQGAPFVLCGDNYQPVGMLLATEGNYQQAKRINAQLQASKPLKNRLWQNIVKAKLTMQAAVLAYAGQPDMPVKALVKKVRSGDPDNIEAQAARRYWTLLFGKQFRRDRDAEGLNAMLNYGYAIIRSATARAVIAAGLHPSVALHHCNSYNAMVLVDDLIEPFRPLIDLKVMALSQAGYQTVTAESKAELAQVLYTDWVSHDVTSPVMHWINKTSTSLAQVFLAEQKGLDLPKVNQHILASLIECA